MIDKLIKLALKPWVLFSIVVFTILLFFALTEEGRKENCIGYYVYTEECIEKRHVEETKESSNVFLNRKGLRPGVDIGGGYHYDLYSGKVEWGYGF